MNSRSLALTVVLVMMTSAGFVSATPSKSYYRAHELHSLDYRVAETRAWDICRDIGSTEKDPCKVDSAVEHRLVLLGPGEAHSRLVSFLAERDPMERPSQRFEVFLLRAGTRPSAALPPHVSRAVEGLREFIPDARFERVAAGIVQTSARGEVRLEGKDGTAYIVELDYRGLRTGRGVPEFSVEILARPLQRDGRPDASRAFITSFLTLSEGETVLVGSSERGATADEVLILILTALAF